MLSSLGFDPSVVERVYVAGGIGSGINMKNAVTIGMFPDIPLEHFHYIGNSSQAGAYAMLVSREAREKVFELEDPSCPHGRTFVIRLSEKELRLMVGRTK